MSEIKASLVLDEITRRISAALPDARVETGWVVLYAPSNQTWPLITVAPTDDRCQAKNTSGTSGLLNQTRIWEIQAALAIDNATTAVSELEAILVALRTALLVPAQADRLGVWGTLLKTQPREAESVAIVPPGPTEQFAGLNLLLETEFIQSV